MEQLTADGKLFPILLKLQSEIPNPEKTAYSSYTQSNFVPLPQLLAHIKPYLEKYNLLLKHEFSTMIIGDKPYLAVEAKLIHESGEEYSNPKMVIPLQHNNPQGLGSAMTYGRRYTTEVLFNLTGEDDDDGVAASKPVKTQSNTQRTSRQTVSETSTTTNKEVETQSEPTQTRQRAKRRVETSTTSDGVKLEEQKGSKPGGRPVAEKVEDPEDTNKLLAKLQKEQSKLYLPLKKKFKDIKNRDAIKEAHIQQYCQELLGEGTFTPDDIAIVKETLDI
jgi:hypothetical protein